MFRIWMSLFRFCCLWSNSLRRAIYVGLHRVYRSYGFPKAFLCVWIYVEQSSGGLFSLCKYLVFARLLNMTSFIQTNFRCCFGFLWQIHKLYRNVYFIFLLLCLRPGAGVWELCSTTSRSLRAIFKLGVFGETFQDYRRRRFSTFRAIEPKNDPLYPS